MVINTFQKPTCGRRNKSACSKFHSIFFLFSLHWNADLIIFTHLVILHYLYFAMFIIAICVSMAQLLVTLRARIINFGISSPGIGDCIAENFKHVQLTCVKYRATLEEALKFMICNNDILFFRHNKHSSIYFSQTTNFFTVTSTNFSLLKQSLLKIIGATDKLMFVVWEK